MLPVLIVILFLDSKASAACTDLYTRLVRAESNPALLIVSDASRFRCVYNVNTIAGLPPAAGTCDLSCPPDSQVIAMYPSAAQPVYLSGAHFDSGNWTGQQSSPATVINLGKIVQFGCTIRCISYVDSAGIQHPTRCNSVDVAAVCSEDRTKPMCTCSANYTGDTCGVQTKSYQTMDSWLGPADSAKMIDMVSVAQSSPAALVSAMPSIYASIPAEKKANMGWTQDEMIDSVDFEMSPVDVNTAFTPIVDEQLGNCFTFNYANKTQPGQFKTRLAGQQRALTITLKMNPSEQVAWIDCAAISTYIHAPGTPPAQGVLYSVKGGTSDLIGLHKTITRLNYGCLKSRDELKGNYYEDGDYTRDGCFSACYQDRVFAKCGCMDASLKKAATASQCLFKDSDCVSAVSAQYGDPSSWSNCHCLPECYQETYSLVSTRAALPFKLPKCTNVTDGCSADVIESVSRLTIYVESLESEIYVEVEKLPFMSMLSQVGGQLGFLLGMSIVGILEIVILCATIGKNQCSHKIK